MIDLSQSQKMFEKYIKSGVYEERNVTPAGIILNDMDIMKAKNDSANDVKGILEYDSKNFPYAYYSNKGIIPKYGDINFAILRSIAKKVGVVSSIHNLRASQLREFSKISYNDEEPGFRVKLIEKDATPTNRQKDEIKKIEEFIRYSGRTDYSGYEDDERTNELPEIIELIARELLTIDQVALVPRFDRGGRFFDYWLLDAATIKRVDKSIGYQGDAGISFVQEIDYKVYETFTSKEILFYIMNRTTELRHVWYGCSPCEMAIELITSWIYSLQYNKEFFNSSAQPKGFFSFEGENIDTSELEDLQRQWQAMFRGVKNQFKTPFLNFNAKWNNIGPNNRDMEFNQYFQVLSSWIGAIYGVDMAELGLRLNQAQNVLSENIEGKINVSADRGLKSLIFGITRVFNKLLKFGDWHKEYQIVATGVNVKNGKERVELEEKQTSIYMTVNELRAQKDMKPIEGGDIILNPTYLQNIQAKQQQKMGGMDEGEEPQPDEQQNNENNVEEESSGGGFQIEEDDLMNSLKKSKNDEVVKYIEIEL
jgi:hypothetical protein